MVIAQSEVESKKTLRNASILVKPVIFFHGIRRARIYLAHFLLSFLFGVHVGKHEAKHNYGYSKRNSDGLTSLEFCRNKKERHIGKIFFPHQALHTSSTSSRANEKL